MNKIKGILAALFMLSVLMGIPQPAAAQEFENDVDYVQLSGDPVFTAQGRFLGGRWLEGAHIIVENRIGGAYSDIIASRTNSWNGPSNGHYYIEAINTPARACEFVINRVVICGVASVPGTAIASATNYMQGSAIVGSIIRVETPNYLINQGWAHNTICHELGHSLGLGHNGQPESQTIMRPNVTPRKLPGPYDYQSIAILYP